MKLIFIVLTICIVVYAEPVPPTREQLDNLVKAMLESIKDAPEFFNKLEIETLQTVEIKLFENKLIGKVKLDLEEKIRESANNADREALKRLHKCRVNITKRFTELAAEISRDLLLQFTSEGYISKSLGHGFSKIKLEMSELIDSLKNHADKEIELCLDGKNKCRLTDEFLSTSEKFFGFQDNMSYVTDTYVKSSDDYFKSEKVNQIILVNFLQPAHKCINEQ